MACDERLVQRIRDEIRHNAGIGERRMFGGVCFTLNGNMFCGVAKDEIMFRIGQANYNAALERPHVREMDFTGRPMRGYVFVARPGIESPASLRMWIGMAREFVAMLPAKVPKRLPAKPSGSRAHRTASSR